MAILHPRDWMDLPEKQAEDFVLAHGEASLLRAKSLLEDAVRRRDQADIDSKAALCLALVRMQPARIASATIPPPGDRVDVRQPCRADNPLTI